MTTSIMVYVAAALYAVLFYFVHKYVAPRNHRDVNSNKARKIGMSFMHVFIAILIYAAYFSDEVWVGTQVVGGFMIGVYIFAMWGFISRKLG